MAEAGKKQVPHRVFGPIQNDNGECNRNFRNRLTPLRFKIPVALVSDSCDKMSDIMASQRITVRVPKTLGSLLRARSRAKGQTPSDVVRVALETYLGRGDSSHSAYDLANAAGLIGCARRVPKDLSTNRRHFEGFGKSK